MSKYRSRATRFEEDVVGNLEQAASLLNNSCSAIAEMSDIEEISQEALRVSAEVEGLVENAKSECDALFEEIDSWKSGMEGTNLENTNKYGLLDDVCLELEGMSSDIECIESFSMPESKDKSVEDFRTEVLETFETMRGDLDCGGNYCPEFPSMFD